MTKRLLLIVCFCVSIFYAYSSVEPNNLLTRGKLVYTSSGSTNSLTDNKFNSGAWTVSNSSWWAVKLESGLTDIFLSWNNPAYPWSNELSPTSCPNNVSFPVDYEILVSNNSTNGQDGDWVSKLVVTGNIVTARGHVLQFAGYTWAKMKITTGSGIIDEIEIFDISKSKSDTWFFPGTSITANTYKGTPPSTNFADLIHSKHSTHYPAMIRGGIGCINSSNFVSNLPKYLLNAGNAHYWAIEMGTNDAWGGTNGNVNTFKSNLQKVIDSCKARGIEPILAKVLATNATAAGWQIHSDFEAAINDLQKTNGLIPGPDLYTWFLNHPSELNSDGIHPNAAGAASIQRLWAEKMDSIYPAQVVNEIELATESSLQIYPNPNKGQFLLECPFPGIGMIYGICGNLISKNEIKLGQNKFDLQLVPGIYLLVATSTEQKKKVLKFVVSD